MVFTYGLISPAMLLLGSIYFGFKYFIDKYNLTVVYPKEYEGNGDISKAIYSFSNFGLILVQLLIFGLFTITLKKDNFFWALVFFLIF
jgi:CTP:phosphocholine cytidylyltransferase-like protein